MKITLSAMLFVVVVSAFSGCKTENRPAKSDVKNETVNKTDVKTETDFISGKVTEIQPGKDGYTVRISTTENQEYLATVSRANLTDPTTYRSVTVGETIQVKGDHWQMENQNHITVRQMK